MKERQGITIPIALAEPPPTGKEHRTIEQAIMLQARSFGKAGGARGVLNLDRIVWLDRGLPSAALLLADLRASHDHFAQERGSPAILLEQSTRRSIHHAHIAKPGDTL